MESRLVMPSTGPIGDAHLSAQNWTLFYALLSRHTTEMYPIIYTPTEADAIQNYSHLFRRPEGLFLTPPWMGKMEDDFVDACEGRELDLVRQRQGFRAMGGMVVCVS
jgi:malate dehydrogenase (oxaloacetate-decarboxylating)